MEDNPSKKFMANTDEVIEEAKKPYMFAFQILWFQCKRAYTNTNVQIWSIWYAVGMCGYLQVICYIQVLWGNIDSEQKVIGYTKLNDNVREINYKNVLGNLEWCGRSCNHLIRFWCCYIGRISSLRKIKPSSSIMVFGHNVHM